MRLFSLLVTIVLIVSLMTSCQPRTTDGLPPFPRRIDSIQWEHKPEIKALTRLIWEYVTPYKYRPYFLFFEGSVAGYDERDILQIELYFTTQTLLEVCEARIFLVDFVEGLLTLLNEDLEVSSYFRNNALTPANLEFSVKFTSYYGEFIDNSLVSWIWLKNGCAQFYNYDIDHKNRDRYLLVKECYSQSKLYVESLRAAEAKYQQKKLEAPPPAPPKTIEIGTSQPPE